MERMARSQLEGLRNVVVEQVNQELKDQTDLLRNAAARDGLIQDILRSIHESGIYDLADFKLNTQTSLFHDRAAYDEWRGGQMAADVEILRGILAG